MARVQFGTCFDPHSRDAGLDGGGGAQRLYASTVGGEGNRQNNHSPGQNNFLTVAGWLSRSCDNCMLQPCHEYPRSLHPQPSPLNPFGNPLNAHGARHWWASFVRSQPGGWVHPHAMLLL